MAQGTPRPGGPQVWRWRNFGQEALDKGTAPQDSFVECPSLPPPAQRGDALPAASAPAETPACEVWSPSLIHPLHHESPIVPPSLTDPTPKLAEYCVHSLPGLALPSEEYTVSAPGVGLQGMEIMDETRAKRVQVNVPDQLQQVRLLLHHHGPEPVLEEMAPSAVPPIECPSIAPQERAHRAAKWAASRAYQQVQVVGHQRPGIHLPGAGHCHCCQPCHKVAPIQFVLKDGPVLDPTYHEVVQNAGSVQTGSSRHAGTIAQLAVRFQGNKAIRATTSPILPICEQKL